MSSLHIIFIEICVFAPLIRFFSVFNFLISLSSHFVCFSLLSLEFHVKQQRAVAINFTKYFPFSRKLITKLNQPSFTVHCTAIVVSFREPNNQKVPRTCGIESVGRDQNYLSIVWKRHVIPSHLFVVIKGRNGLSIFNENSPRKLTKTILSFFFVSKKSLKTTIN